MATPAPNDSLLAAINIADAGLTSLDDKTDIENRAVYRWLSKHQFNKHSDQHIVIGNQNLPPNWRGSIRKFTSSDEVKLFLLKLAHEAGSKSAIHKLAQEFHIYAGSGGDKSLFDQLAQRIYSGAAWVIVAKRMKSRFAAKTSPAVFEAVNRKFGAKIKFEAIAKLEGDQWLRGYVPINSKNGLVAGRSGMTIASGFDVGQWSVRQLRDLGFPPALLQKLSPFTSLPLKGMTKMQVAERIARIGPVPIITKSEADICDGAVFGKILDDAKKNWDGHRSPDVPQFVHLPPGWQTLWLSRFIRRARRPRAFKPSYLEKKRWPEIGGAP